MHALFRAKVECKMTVRQSGLFSLRILQFESDHLLRRSASIRLITRRGTPNVGFDC